VVTLRLNHPGGYGGGGRGGSLGGGGLSSSATARQCAIAGEWSVGLRSLTTRRPQAGQNAGRRPIDIRE
jgi:hypothetical protein